MAEAQLLAQLKFKVGSLETTLIERNKELEDLRTVEEQADGKIKAISKMHADKVKSLLNSIQILKKEKAAVEGLNKQHKRSKLIEQLNREILDQDLVIEVLRKCFYDEKGREEGRAICDEIIVKALTKGPERIRPLTREELRMEIQKLKSANLAIDGKVRLAGKKQEAGQSDNISEVSSISTQSFSNPQEEVLQKMRQVQKQNECLKLELNAKAKIIEKLRNDLKQKEKLRAEVEMLVNQVEISNKKLLTYEGLLKKTKEAVNLKIVDLYERELKVEELEVQSKEDSHKLKQAHESNNVLLQEIRFEKEQLATEFEVLKKENEQLMLENITSKKRQDQQKNKILEIRDINDRKKNELSEKLAACQQQIAVFAAESKRVNDAYRTLEAKVFEERGNWVEQKSKLLEQISQSKTKQMEFASNQAQAAQFEELRSENERLKALVGVGGGSDDHLLLERLDNYRRKLEFYEKGQTKDEQRKMYDQLFQKFNALSVDFEQYKKDHPETKQKIKRKHMVQMTRKEQQKMGNLSSGVSELNLEEISSDILDNFDSSYDFELELNAEKSNGKYPRITEADKQLLKLLNSDLWEFMKDDELANKIDEAVSQDRQHDSQGQIQLMNRIQQIKNLSHPQGRKLLLYQNEIAQLDEMSDSVSITSALGQQINKYDSELDIEVKKVVDYGKSNVNLRALNDISMSLCSDAVVSSVHSGESNIVKKNKKPSQKATKIKLSSSKAESVSEGMSFNSDVSSVNMGDSALDRMDSDVSTDFRKKKAH